MVQAKKDENGVPVLMGVSNVDGATPVMVYVDPVTHRMLVDLAAGAGTVTSVSVVTANGISGSVATATTTPAITLTLGNITPSGVLISGLTASELVATDASKNLVSLAVATYPSLAELSYVKGVTSGIQAQINAKVSNIPVASDPIWDAAGDLAVGTGADTAARLPIGTALQLLRVKSDASGLEYVDPGSVSSAVSGTDYYFDDTVIIPAGTGPQTVSVETLSTTPSASTEVTESVVVNTSVNSILMLGSAHMDGIIGATSIPAGQWDFHLYRYASTATGTNEIIVSIYLNSLQAGTIAITGTGTSRTATVTGGTPFLAGDVNASMALGSWIQTPNAQMRITGFTSSSVVTVECLSTYTNESGVAYYKDTYNFSQTTGDIQETTVTSQVMSVFKAAITTLSTDRLITRLFAQTNSAANRTLSFVYGGATNYSHLHSPAFAKHSNLANLDFANSGHTGFAPSNSPTLVTPVLGVATATSINGLTITTTTGTLTIPNGVVLTGPASSGTAMTLGNAETVTGAKTFGDALIIATTPKIVTGLKDTNGVLILGVTPAASAVNQITVVNAVTTAAPEVQATGTDTNIDLKLVPKGTGKVAPQKSVNFGAFTAYFTETDNGNSSTADTIDWTLSNKQKSTLTGNCTFTFTAPPGPCSLILKLVQDGTGSRTVTWPAAVHWSGGTAPTLTTTINKVDIISFYWDGTTYFGNSTLNFTA